MFLTDVAIPRVVFSKSLWNGEGLQQVGDCEFRFRFQEFNFSVGRVELKSGFKSVLEENFNLVAALLDGVFKVFQLLKVYEFVFKTIVQIVLSTPLDL